MAALLFLVNALLTLVVMAFLLRLLMPLTRADMRSPVGQAVLRFTNPIVMPLRKLLRPTGRLDTASVVALLLVQLAATAAVGMLGGAPVSPGPLLLRTARDLLRHVLQFYFVAVLVYALLSWVAAAGHGNDAYRLLGRLCEPLLAPIRRVIPPIAGLDLSALFLLLGLQALQILVS
jgi:YggT family protein